MFAATRVEPVWVGVGVALAIFVPLLIGAQLTGRLAELAKVGFFTVRDARTLTLFVALFAYTVTARRYVMLGAARAFEALRPVLEAQRGVDIAQLRAEIIDQPTNARTRRRRALVSLAIAPVVAFAIDRDLSLYLIPEYWSYERTWQWTVGLVLCWNLGLLHDAGLEYGRRFGALARRLERIDLLGLKALAPFANLGMRIALLWLLMAAVFSLNLVDADYWSPVLGLTALTVALAASSVLPPILGARDRVRETKREELDRIAAWLRGEPGALRGSVLEARAETVGVADLLAYREMVTALHEWPFDAPMLLRLLLYVAIPIGSWIGGAFVEQLLQTTLR